MANERIFGQEADTQLLESLGVFSMVDKTQRTEFINSTVSEINSAYKQLHELQMSYISQQLGEGSRREGSREVHEGREGLHRSARDRFRLHREHEAAG